MFFYKLVSYFSLSFTTPFSTNAVSAFESTGIYGVKRLERSTRYYIKNDVTNLIPEKVFSILGDRMVECLYIEPPSFSQTTKKENAFEIDILGLNGRENLQKANNELALVLDQADFEYYYDFFLNKVHKNPTDVELFDLAQSNSEHSRHWFFRGELYINGQKRPESLFKSIQDTQKHSNKNNVIAFCDNSRYLTFSYKSSSRIKLEL